MLGFLIIYLKGMRIMMFQLSGYYYNLVRVLYKEIVTQSPKREGFSRVQVGVWVRVYELRFPRPSKIPSLRNIP